MASAAPTAGLEGKAIAKNSYAGRTIAVFTSGGDAQGGLRTLCFEYRSQTDVLTVFSCICICIWQEEITPKNKHTVYMVKYYDSYRMCNLSGVVSRKVM